MVKARLGYSKGEQPLLPRITHSHTPSQIMMEKGYEIDERKHRFISLEKHIEDIAKLLKDLV
jgi:hypothetical protein